MGFYSLASSRPFTHGQISWCEMGEGRTLIDPVYMTTIIIISSLYVCMVNIELKYNFVETSRKFIIFSLLMR